MKIYLASSFLNKKNARLAMDMLEKAGHTITHDWTTHAETTDLKIFERESVEDLQGVKDADVLILLWPGRLGSASELGAALALGKTVLLVSLTPPYLDSVYFNHPSVRVVATMADAVDRLRWL